MTSNGLRTANPFPLSRYTLILAVCLLGTPLNLPSAQAQEKQRPSEESCAEGYYNGPRPGRKVYSNDKYLWVVTPAFAKRFCMPPEFVDENLKGAEAVAFRMTSAEHSNSLCTVIDGKEECPGEDTLRFDIFLRSDLNLPAINPDVKFYNGNLNDAGQQIFLNEKQNRWKKYKSGEYKSLPGAIPRFMSPVFQIDNDYVFSFARVYQGKRVWSVVGLVEWGYLANWSDKLDLLVLQGNGFEAVKPQESGISYAIVMGKSDAYVSGNLQNFSHTIWLPARFYEKVHTASRVRGKSWLDQLRILRQQ